MSGPNVEEFAGKTALVTGASRGIGRAVAVELARLGARVAVHYHTNHAAAEATLAELSGDGHIAVAADIADAAAVAAMVDEVSETFGRIDVLVNNAARYVDHAIAGVTYPEWQAAWQATLATNLLGTANVTYCVARRMIAEGGGRIVNVSSRGAFRGEPDHPAYAASKAGLNAMGQSLAQALAPFGISVLTVAPGFVETEMAAPYLDGPAGDAIRAQSPFGRVATPEEVAHSVAFLASERAAFASGAILDLNGASYLRT
jgi:NAD(P)-dependent dehydrogenase (short-subunit alcohol dehydrogenase family)